MTRGLVALALLLFTSAAAPAPINVLIVTGDQLSVHDWRATSLYFKEFLPQDRFAVEITETPSRSLTPENLGRFDVLLLNYRDSPEGAKRPDTVWSETNKAAFVDAIRRGKGLYVFHNSSGAFAGWADYERVIAGGARSQAYHGPQHRFTVTPTNARHPITARMPDFLHERDDLLSNAVLFPEATVLATAYSDPNRVGGTGLNEAVLWVKPFGRGRVVNMILGHDVAAMKSPGFQTLATFALEWAATGQVSAPLHPDLATRYKTGTQ